MKINSHKLCVLMFLLGISVFHLEAQKSDTVFIKQLLDSALKVEFVDNSLAQKISQSALSLSQNKGYEKFKSKALTILGYLHDDIGKFDQAKRYYEQSMAVNVASNDKKLIGLDYSNLGLNAENKGNLMEAIAYQKKALEIREEIKDTFGIAGSNNNIGNIYGRQGDYAKALAYFLRSLKLVELSKQEQRLPPQLNNIAIVYNRLKQYDKAIEYYSRALTIWEKFKNYDGMAMANYNIASLYRDNRNYDMALKYANEALRLNKELGNTQGMSECYNSLGSIYSLQKDHNKALNYFNLALKTKSESGDSLDLANIYQNLASLNIELGQNQNAAQYLDKALPIALKNRQLIDLKEIYRLYYLNYKNTNNKDLSLKYHELYFAINDSIYNVESTKQLNELNTRYETEKKEKENQLLTAKNELSEKTLKEQKLITYIIVAGLLIAVVFAFFIFRGLKQQRRANRIIASQKEIVERQKHEVEEHRKEILDSIHYAKRIQNTLLAHHDFLNEHLPNNFVLFKPKDIVSGDFYWATSVNIRQIPGSSQEQVLPTADCQLFYLAVCDSTGHGVPGAFMSLLNIGFLTEAINEKHIREPNKIFDYVRQRLTESVSKEGQKDGFDGILLCFELPSFERGVRRVEDVKITYAAAHNAPILISNNELTELPKDKMPVGIGERAEGFNLYTIDLKAGDSLYLYTDGYADQFGGPKGKKLKYKALNDLLMSNVNQSMNDQSLALDAAFNGWKGNLEQVDDVCIIGLRL